MITPPTEPSREDIAQHYDSLDVFYREVWGDHLHHGYWITGRETTPEAIRNLTTAVADLARISRSDTVIDVGCGYGAASIWLAEHLGAKVSGVTLSSQQCIEAKILAEQLPAGIPKPEFICADWLDNDLPDASVDAIISIECLSHIPDKAAFFKEVARVLKPGGRLGLCDWLAKEQPAPWEKRHLLEPICHDGHLAELCNAEELRELALEAGLKVREFREVGRHVRKTWRVITARLCAKLITKQDYRKFLIENLQSDRVFALTITRLIAAYATGALNYGLLGAEKITANDT
tara:strand:+ start:1837 stop:2709 length:873 start_codon:yes stop_codon:yes gene_type:complete